MKRRKVMLLAAVMLLSVTVFGCAGKNATQTAVTEKAATETTAVSTETKNSKTTEAVTEAVTETATETGTAQQAKASDIAKPYDGLRVMIVGSGSPQLEVDRGQPSTLVQYHDKYFLVDCGNGACDTLLENGITTRQITNMLFTHQHSDHNGDFWDLFMTGSLVAFPRQTFTVIGPGVTNLMNTTLTFYKQEIDQKYKGLGLTNSAAVYDTTVKELTENTEFELDGVKITTMKLPHGLTDFAYKFEADGQSVVITGDFLNIPELADFAKGSDIFVVDGMLTSTFDYIPNADARAGLKKSLEVSHATAEQVESIVANAQASQTVFSHLGGSSGIDQTTAALQKLGYTGKAIAAEDGLIIEPEAKN